jgi:hypothetical protein
MIPIHVKLYNVKEVAEILHLSVYRIRQFIRARTLKGYVHLGRCNTKRLYVLEEYLRHFIFATEPPPPEPPEQQDPVGPVSVDPATQDFLRWCRKKEEKEGKKNWGHTFKIRLIGVPYC